MQPVHKLLHQSKHNSARDKNDHGTQAVAIEGPVIALEILRAVHEPPDGEHDPHGNGDAPLARALAVELHPRVVHGVVPDREGVDDGPQRPPLPHAHAVRILHRARRDQCREVARLRGDDGGAACPCAVAQPREEEYYGEGGGGTHGRERVGGDAGEAEGEVDGRRVGRQRGPGREDDGGREVVRPALVV